MFSAQRIEFLSELLALDDVDFWILDRNGNVLQTNCSRRDIAELCLKKSGCLDRIFNSASSSHNPCISGDELGLTYGAAFLAEQDALSQVYIIGPFLFSDVDENSFRQSIDKYYRNTDKQTADKIISVCKQLPVIPNTVFFRYLLMLHYALNGEKLSISDLNYLTLNFVKSNDDSHHDRYKVWETEQYLLDMVKQGNLNYKSAFQNSAFLSSGVPVKGADPLRQAKTSLTVFISIVSRAAMSGGLSPEISYSLGNTYMQNVEQAKTLSELTALAPAMYEDFIRRVNQVKTSPKLSKPIKKCCDYIDLHIEESISAASLAKHVNYTEYYLTKKFKAEIGLSVNDYVKKVRIERAKLMLSCTDKSIQQISEELCFCSREYFTQIFKELVGVAPQTFRKSSV